MSARALVGRFLMCYMALGGLSGGYESFAAEPFAYEPVIVELSGRLVIEDHYGPPNFGETPDTDKKEKVPILDLDMPIAVTANGTSSVNIHSFGDVRRVQLIGLPTLNPTNLAGQRLRVQGTLFEKQSGENYTDVLMNVQEVTPIH